MWFTIKKESLGLKRAGSFRDNWANVRYVMIDNEREIHALLGGERREIAESLCDQASSMKKRRQACFL